jgi:nucleoside-diphosphate-sugar epimerase
VDDAVDAMLTLAAAPAVARGAVYNVCTGVQTTVRDAVDLARGLMDVAAEPSWATMPPRAWDTGVWVGSPATLETEIGWRAPTAFAAGLRQTLHWLQSDPDRRRFYEQRILRSATEATQPTQNA